MPHRPSGRAICGIVVCVAVVALLAWAYVPKEYDGKWPDPVFRSIGGEKIAIVSVSWAANTLNVTAKSIGGTTVEITRITIDDAYGCGEIINGTNRVIRNAFLSADGTIVVVSTMTSNVAPGSNYTAVLWTKLGNCFSSSEFKA